MPPTGDIASLVRDMLPMLGDDPDREGLNRTPERVEKALRFLTEGYHKKVDDIVNGALFSVEYDEMVVVRDIEFFSLCEHHMLPFYGKIHVAYLPKDKVIGLSKIPRIVDMFSRRLQVQERLTQQVARILKDAIDAEGVGVVMGGTIRPRSAWCEGGCRDLEPPYTDVLRMSKKSIRYLLYIRCTTM